MGIKDFLKPSIVKILAFLSVGLFYLYFASESVSAAGFSFAVFYSAYGFPFQYLIIGDIDNLSGIIKDMFLGNYFTKFGNTLINPAALALDLILIYSFACLISMLFAKMKSNNKNS